ncbi:universal stress protein [Desulfohalobiaceae bacterium Ax17]|uniref:universal stress protein n=1 Tax=Desulfovulcanus ferrireducens TaxID=2831190 RepID=UPI00207B9CF9|nr:universal stress protein [Desulfovulcanus ferrireducens]MBT8763694.1 universal stress protein [Desulfovulcanus ferrireducens]
MGIYKHILVMTDFSLDSEHAVKVSAQMALFFKSNLTILHVAHDESQFSLFINKSDYAQIKEKIDEEINDNFKQLEIKIPELREVQYTKKVRRGIPYVEGLLEIESGDYDLVVVGSHGLSGIKTFFYGSTSEKIVRRSPVAVHITRLK